MKDSDDENVSDKKMVDIPLVVKFCYEDFTVKKNVISAKCKFCSEKTIISDKTGISDLVTHLQIFHSQMLKLDYDKLRMEEVRLRSFHSWPSRASADPQILAREGLFYTLTDDRVQCTFCRGILRKWEPADIPSVKHRKHYPDCPFVRGQDVGNVPISREPNYAGRKTDDDDRKALNKVHGKRQRMIQNPRESTQASTRKQEATVDDLVSTARDRKEVANTLTPIMQEINKNDLRILLSKLKLKRDYDKLRMEEVRLRSFHSWPSRASADPQILAREGLFYTGTDDRVQCAFCRGILRKWEPADIPSVEHQKHYPDCPFVRGQDVGNVPISREPNYAGRKTDDDDRKALNKAHGKRQRMIQNPRESTQASTRKQVWPVHVKPPMFPGYDSISQRFNSFLRGHVSRGQTAEGLAEAGWFWIGPDDNVQCFQCGVVLKEWQLEDDPWKEHKKFSANCSHVKNHFTATRTQLHESAQMQDHQNEKALVEEKFSISVSEDGRTGHCGPDDIIRPIASSHSRATTGSQVEDAQLDSCKVAEGTPVDAIIDREEIQIVLRVMGNCDSNRDLLKTLISERLSRGEECLNPAKLLDAVFRMYAS